MVTRITKRERSSWHTHAVIGRRLSPAHHHAETVLPYPVFVFTGTLLWSILIDAFNAPLLIAQARVEELMAVSSDGHWPGYDVSLHRV